MIFVKKYENGLRLVVNKIDGLLSVSTGVLVKTGSRNESKEENGISHFIEHTLFKGTSKRSAFEISDYIDGIGAQINAFTSKELTCYYTKSTAEHLEDSAEVLSDIFFNSIFDEEELEKEKGVVIEEINMSEDTPEDICFDLSAQSYYGEEGLGRTILGPAENIKSFTKKDILEYMNKYYTSDNVVISFAGNVDAEEAQRIVEKHFVNNFKVYKSAQQKTTEKTFSRSLSRKKQIEQSHLAFTFPTFRLDDDRSDALAIINTILGGGMSSRLFQKIREELGLAYSVYSYPSQYKDGGVLEIYAGVNTALRDKASSAILEEVKKLKENGVTEREFLRAKEQIKSSFIMSRESTASQMLLYGKCLIFTDKEFDFDKRLRDIEAVTIEEVNALIKEVFDFGKLAIATVGPKDDAIKI